MSRIITFREEDPYATLHSNTSYSFPVLLEDSKGKDPLKGLLHYIMSFRIRSHYPERPSILDFKDAAAPKCGHSDVIFCQL